MRISDWSSDVCSSDLPRMRWSHSQKKIALNAASDMPRLISLYSGICLYFSNSASHAASLSGGSTPVTGSHSVIDRPDSVRRVMPPRSEEHTSELQSLMRISYAVFCLKKKNQNT